MIEQFIVVDDLFVCYICSQFILKSERMELNLHWPRKGIERRLPAE
jgi:hypothetical protein